MSHFVGVDLHRSRAQVAVIDDAGREVLSRQVPNDRQVMLRLLSGLDDPHVAVEATYGWEWFVELLEDHGVAHTLSHPKATKAIASARVKTDAIDAMTLAQLLRVDMLPAAYVATRQIRDVRGIVRHRVGLTQLRTSLKNRVRALVASHGATIRVNNIAGLTGKAALAALDLRDPVRERIDSYLNLIGALDAEITRARDTILAHADNDPRVRVLTQIPGVGKFIAMVVICEIADPHRFPDARHLVSWAGLAPTVRNSGTTTHIGHITRQGSPHLRWALVQAAHVAYRHPGPLNAMHTRISARRGNQIATVAVARRILELAYYGLRDGHIRALNPTPTT